MSDSGATARTLPVLNVPIGHDSAARHVSGEALYIDDIPEPPGLLHLYVGQAARAHARVTRLDLAAVRAAPGVVLVLTPENVLGKNDISPFAGDDPLFAEGVVRFMGQPLFSVAAETLPRARAAAALAVVEYADLEPLVTTDAARAAEHTIEPAQVMRLGDAHAAIAAAPHRVAGHPSVGGQEHFYLEGQIALVIPGAGADLPVWPSTQHPTETQHVIARVLGCADAAVTVEVRRMGGGFGGKETQSVQWAAMAALTALKTRRPAKIRLDRDDDMVMTGKRHDFEIDWELGFDADGRLRGAAFDLASRCGHSADLSHAINDRAMFHADNAYCLQTAEIVSHRLRTHTVSNTAFRGFGGPQGMMGIERVMDVIAWRLGKDPLDVRKANLYGAAPRNVTQYGQTVEDNIAPDLITALEAKSNYRARRKAIEAFNAQSPVPSAARADAGQVRHLVHHHAPQSGGRAGACLCRRVGAPEPWRHRDGAGPVHQGGAGRGRGIRHRPGTGEDHRHHHRQGAQHLRHRRVRRRRPERHGGHECGGDHQAASGRIRRLRTVQVRSARGDVP